MTLWIIIIFVSMLLIGACLVLFAIKNTGANQQTWLDEIHDEQKRRQS